MIGYLTGTIKTLSEKSILVLTQSGVGYEVFPAGSLLANCKMDGEFEAEILTIVRETEISLYGFGHSDEKTLFLKLINVSGIGPKMALKIISTPPENFLSAVEAGDVPFLTKIPGLGKKTAERLIIELRGKINLKENLRVQKTSAETEAEEALSSLGYDKNTITKVLEQAPDESRNVAEDLVKYFLSSNA